MTDRSPHEDEAQGEEGVELQEDQQVVELVVPGADEVAQVGGVARERARGGPDGQEEVDDRPAQIGHGHQGEAAAPEGSMVDAGQVAHAVGEHAGGDEEEGLAGDVEQLQRRPHGHAGGHRGEEEQRVGRHHADLLDRTHRIDVVETLARPAHGLRRGQWGLVGHQDPGRNARSWCPLR